MANTRNHNANANDNAANNNTENNNAANPPPTLEQVLMMQAQMFQTMQQTMDADEWLKTVEKKFQVVQCNNRERVLPASHQLTGLVAD
jgi:hypothetical protein